MSTYGCVRTDNMSGTTLGKDLVSIEYQVSSAAAAIENGNVVVVGALKTGSREIHIGGAMAVDSALGSLALIASEEVIKNKGYNGLSEFRNEAGAIARGYRFASKDVFSVTSVALTGSTAAVGSYVECAVGTKLKVVSSITSGSTKVGTVIALEGDWIVIEVA